MTFLLVHAFYKAGLFLAVGMIEKGAGSRDYPAVAGLARGDAADRGGDRAGGALHGRAAAALRLHRQGADLRGDRPRAALAAGRDRGGDRRQRADGGLRRRWWRSGRSSSRRARSPKDTPGRSRLGPRLGPAILAALGLLCGLAPGARSSDALVAPMVLAVAGRADGGPPRALARARRAAAAQPRRPSRSAALLYLAARPRSATASPRPSRALPRTEGWYDAALARPRGRWRARLTGAVQNGRMTSYLRAHLPGARRS